MTLADCCKKSVVTVSPTTTVDEVARIMKEKNVGSVIVTYNDVPVGIVTDRDLTLRVLAERKRADNLPVEDVMTRDLSTLKGDMGLYEAIEFITERGIRRIPIVGSDEKLMGIITLDDVLLIIGREMKGVADIIERESPDLYSF
ncbi:MAG TPA: CBS domain-containing protein [Methanomicrobiales archaeon]|nr:CBS domain-containing protein [Methanomicrobiales archaeon]